MQKVDEIFRNLQIRKIITISTDDFYSEIRDLTGDLIFLKELASRMKKSKFDFICVPTLNGHINGIFLRKLWSNATCRGWSINEDTVTFFLKIYYSTKGFFEVLNNRDLTIDENLMIKDLNEILSSEFKMTLCEESNDFIGCSSSCGAVISKLRKLGLK